MDGTQMPTKIAAFASPLKYNISEKISERKAAIKNILSAVVNFLIMILLRFKFCIFYMQNVMLQKIRVFVQK